MTRKVIVVGAGLAGLAAAQLLQRRGLQVSVLEREPRVGGRVYSQAFHGRTIECGAQFPSTGYRYVPALLDEAGLLAVLCPPWAAFEREGCWHRVHQNRPISLWSGGLLRASEFARMGWGVATTLRRSDVSEPASYASYAAVDSEDAKDWCTRVLGSAAAEMVFEPSVHGFYFHPLAGCSRALLQALLSFRNSQALAVPFGWDALPRSMAASLTVHTGSRVSAVIPRPGGVTVRVNDECLEADAAVIATPAPIGRDILHAPTVQEQALLSTCYAAAIHVALGFAQGWHPPEELRGVHGCLLGPDSPVAAMVVEQSRLPCPAPEVLTLMMGDAAARRLQVHSDSDVLLEVLAWLGARWPGIPGAVLSHRLHRWALAEPLSPPGRARAVQHYRSTFPRGRRVVVCGDGTALPWTDGAVESGLWAASRLLEEVS